jgi:hypothetical protein
MEEDNIIFETMPEPDWSKIVPQQQPVDEKEYDSLYEELLDKCNPKNFDIKKYGYEKFNEANLIYSQIRNLKSAPETDLIAIRNLAIEKLGIHISTKKKYNELEEYLNPNQYVDNEDYNVELVSIVGKIYEELLSAQYDIRHLEEIEGREIVKRVKEKQGTEEKEYFINKSASEYLNKYPKGRYAEEARYYQDDNVTARMYLDKFPNGRYKKEAEDACRENKILIIGVSVLFVLFTGMMAVFWGM